MHTTEREHEEFTEKLDLLRLSMSKIIGAKDGTRVEVCYWALGDVLRYIDKIFIADLPQLKKVYEEIKKLNGTG